MKVGISQPVGSLWFRQAGGIAPSHLAPSFEPLSDRYLSFSERGEIALWRAQGFGVREIARRTLSSNDQRRRRSAFSSNTTRIIPTRRP